ncbi:hypothetical protein ACTPD5_21555, partial [Clostridioides difficile]
NLRNKLVDVAEDNNLDYAVDVFTFYGSDASEAIRWGEDVQIALGKILPIALLTISLRLILP